MKTKQFKTNINCLGCVARVTPVLNPILGENNWEVNIRDRDKILTVPTENLDEKSLVEQVKSAGFKIELIE